MSYNKYKAVPTTVDGIRFASIGEANRYRGLKLLEQNGAITDLKLQQPFDLEIFGYKVCTYRADFTYFENGRFVVEDFKGFVTPEFKLKAKLFEALYGYPIRITGQSKAVKKCPPGWAQNSRQVQYVKPRPKPRVDI